MGEKSTVYTRGSLVACRFDTVPLTALKLASDRPDGASENDTVMALVWPAPITLTLVLRVAVGPVTSST
ncbi:hypothetical protein DUPY_43870 [Duganella phyllosphaerae]|uniref:Uncharacterized protein n=1 Tax=Duganella phyllosphaerae TaxID=762836 RepID=A0A1E7WCJ3_9BURK|nr:hypothetical protein DUPY_43870 [Duganella phyllosphaerae]